ncbi:MAG TPA: Uma2 family endonuclease [Thermoanaerobaculia bacterium]|jgi:Uma2 family endonuclease|nr:Uma2 family endonuclease [Thermoanaerobaculia bacterium]
MAIQDRIRKLTYDDYAQIPDDGKRHEVIDGLEYVTPYPYPAHQRLLLDVYMQLASHIHEPEILLTYCDVVLSPHDIVQPDLFFVSKERLGIVTELNIQGPPDLVVEILAEQTRHLDEGLKPPLYEHTGVGEFWLVDGFRKRITVFRRVDSIFCRAPELSAEAEDMLATPLVPGLEIPLAEIFE